MQLTLLPPPNSRLIHERTECSHDQISTSRRTYPRNRIVTFDVPDRVQKACATDGTAGSSAWPVGNRRCPRAVFTGNSRVSRRAGVLGNTARARPRADGSNSAAIAADYSCWNFSVYANFESVGFENQHRRRPL